MKFICAQPAIDYYTWQVEVMINNFIKNGVNPEDIQIVCAHHGSVSEKWQKLAKGYPDVKFYFYADQRQKPCYISSVRPHILYQHWLNHPELINETVFYHDCDIIFSKPIDFEGLIDNDTCYVSDTVSYIGANYVRSKGEHYLDLMADIVNVNKQYVIEQEKNSGGAQYLLKNVPIEFWKKVYYDAENLYRLVTHQIEKDKKDNPSMHEIQIWCADMWAVLWNLWFWDKAVEVTKKLSFSWATSGSTDWDRYPIFHNAGVTGDHDGLFYKGKFQLALPYEEVKSKTYNTNFCSSKYAEEVLKTGEVSCLK
jgi:hypothetical protein